MSTPGSGRRIYPAECLEIFKTIRQGFRKKWNRAQIEDLLRDRFNPVSFESTGDRPDGIDARPIIEPDLVASIAASMETLAAAVNRQEGLRHEVEQLRREIDRMQEQQRQQAEDHHRQMERLAAEIGRRQQHSGDARRPADAPRPEVLQNPLTVHYPPNRYLGIKDHNGTALNMEQVIQTIQRNAADADAVAFSWHRRAHGWSFESRLKRPGDGNDDILAMDVRLAVTPLGNATTEVVRMQVAEQELSKKELLKFFRLMKTRLFEDD